MSENQIAPNLLDLPPDYVFDSIYEIETAMEMIRSLDDRISYYDNLKKHRAAALAAKMNSIESISENLRKIILNTMRAKAPKQKTLDFPGVGKVTRKSNADAWIIEEEERMLAFVKESGHHERVVEQIQKVNKKKLNELLDHYDAEGLKVPGVSKETGRESIAITHVKENKNNNGSETTVSKNTLEDLDDLLV